MADNKLISIAATEIHPRWGHLTYAALGIAIAALVFLGWLVHCHSPGENIAPVNVWVPAKVAKQVADVPKVSTPIKGGAIKTYPASVKNGLKLPPAIKDDPAQQVVAATHVNADDHPATVTTTVNTETGETETIVRREPLPWMAWSDRGGVGVYAGIKNGAPAVRLQAHQELFTVKAVHFGAVASIDQQMSGPISADYFVGVGAEYRW